MDLNCTKLHDLPGYSSPSRSKKQYGGKKISVQNFKPAHQKFNFVIPKKDESIQKLINFNEYGLIKPEAILGQQHHQKIVSGKNSSPSISKNSMGRAAISATQSTINSKSEPKPSRPKKRADKFVSKSPLSHLSKSSEIKLDFGENINSAFEKVKRRTEIGSSSPAPTSKNSGITPKPGRKHQVSKNSSKFDPISQPVKKEATKKPKGLKKSKKHPVTFSDFQACGFRFLPEDFLLPKFAVEIPTAKPVPIKVETVVISDSDNDIHSNLPVAQLQKIKIPDSLKISRVGRSPSPSKNFRKKSGSHSRDLHQSENQENQGHGDENFSNRSASSGRLGSDEIISLLPMKYYHETANKSINDDFNFDSSQNLLKFKNFNCERETFILPNCEFNRKMLEPKVEPVMPKVTPKKVKKEVLKFGVDFEKFACDIHNFTVPSLPKEYVLIARRESPKNVPEVIEMTRKKSISETSKKSSGETEKIVQKRGKNSKSVSESPALQSPAGLSKNLSAQKKMLEKFQQEKQAKIQRQHKNQLEKSENARKRNLLKSKKVDFKFFGGAEAENFMLIDNPHIDPSKFNLKTEMPICSVFNQMIADLRDNLPKSNVFDSSAFNQKIEVKNFNLDPSLEYDKMMTLPDGRYKRLKIKNFDGDSDGNFEVPQTQKKRVASSDFLINFPTEDNCQVSFSPFKKQNLETISVLDFQAIDEDFLLPKSPKKRVNFNHFLDESGCLEGPDFMVSKFEKPNFQIDFSFFNTTNNTSGLRRKLEYYLFIIIYRSGLKQV